MSHKGEKTIFSNWKDSDSKELDIEVHEENGSVFMVQCFQMTVIRIYGGVKAVTPVKSQNAIACVNNIFVCLLEKSFW